MTKKTFFAMFAMLALAMPSFAQDEETATEATEKTTSWEFYVGGGMECMYGVGPWNNILVNAGTFINDVNIEVAYGFGNKTPIAELDWPSTEVPGVYYRRSYAIESTMAAHFGIRAYTWKCLSGTVRIGAVHANVAVNDMDGQKVESTGYTTARLGLKIDIKPIKLLAISLEPEYVIPLSTQPAIEQIAPITDFEKMQQGIGIRATVNLCF